MPEDQGGGTSLLDSLPTDRLREAAQTLLKAATDKAVSAALEQVEGLTGRLTDVAENGGTGLKAALGGGEAAAKGENPVTGALKGGLSAVTDKVKGVFGGGGGDGGGSGNAGGGGGSGKFKFMNVVEELDVGVPIRIAYDQWTLFADFPSFMKKVHTVEQESDEKTNWYAQVWWSKRSWQATIIEQIPDTHIIWRSTGAKGYVNGIVSFHEIAPSLTRVLLVLEYYPVGLFEKTANIWRAVGRRARLEFKHYRRHVMVHTLLDREDLEGWRGEIRDSEVVETHEEALEREAAEREESGEGSDPYGDEERGEYADDSDEADEYEDGDYEDLDADEEAADVDAEDKSYEDEPVDDDEDVPEDDEPVAEDDGFDDVDDTDLDDEPEPVDDVDEPEDDDEESGRSRAEGRSDRMTVSQRQGGSRVDRAPQGDLAQVIDLILDKGLVIDVFVKVSLVGIELVTIDARIVVASVDTYLRFAEATNRLDLHQKGGKDLGEVMGGMAENTTHGGAKGATKGALEAGKEKWDDFRGERNQRKREKS